MSFLEVSNIEKSFGKNTVLKSISFELEKGEILSMIGSSGSGKTTLLRCMNFLEVPEKGKIVVNGETLFDGDEQRKISEREIREKRLHFGLVFQQFNLFPQYTVLKNVTLAEELLAKDKLKKEGSYDGKTSKREINEMINERALELLRSVGLYDKASSYPCNISGGQQQRVAIARALALKPDILCFDEPTSALDPELTGEVLKVIRELKSSDRTMIIVTHEIEFARDVSDKVMFMSDGIIEEFGTPEEVIGDPKSERTKAFLSRFAGK
jgi:polar amino acid transport system ATP-binding protein